MSGERTNCLEPSGYEIGWEHEDELSHELSKSDYDKMFPFSRVISGVRMFPFVNIWEDSYGNAIRVHLPFHNVEVEHE